jgi:tryptophan 2,3-dioxygenase
MAARILARRRQRARPARNTLGAMSQPRATTYWDYLHLEELLSLQDGLPSEPSPPGDEEVLFITVHQVFELWFKLVLNELRAARNLFGHEVVQEQQLSGVVAGFERVTTILRTGAQHFELMETLSLRQYLEFRTKLMPASGFQSAQLRCVEILMGLDESTRVPLGAQSDPMGALREPDGSESPAYRAVAAAREDSPTLLAALEGWLERTPIDGVRHDAPGADQALDTFLGRYLEAHGREVDAACEHAMAIARGDDERAKLEQMYAREKRATAGFLMPSEGDGGRRRARIRAAMIFIETYRELPLLAWPREVLAKLIELEQAFLIFRQRHARMVERVIGRRIGTGGSDGVAYLDKTAHKYRIFGDLWAVRTLMIRPGATPDLDRPEFYDFKSGQ